MKKRRKIYFRADAGEDIGYGHFIRSLALASMLKDDFDCTFFTQTPTEYQIKEAKGICSLVELPSDESKLDKFLDLLSGDEIVVLDNYFFTSEYQDQIKKKGCKLVYIDPLVDRHYFADILLVPSIVPLVYFPAISSESYSKIYSGNDYLLLRPPFLNGETVTTKVCEAIEYVSICFGGSDKFNITDRVIESLLTFPSIKRIDAIVGSHYKSSMENLPSSVNYLKSATAEVISSSFRASDLVISSASSTVIEALSSNKKVAAGYYVDNQEIFYEYLCESRLIYGLGNLIECDIRTLLEPIFNDKPFDSINDFSIDTDIIINNFIHVFKAL